MRSVSRATGALLAASLTAMTLSACSERIPDPQPAAQALTQALESADFSAVPLTADSDIAPAEILAQAFEPVQHITRVHQLESVTMAESTDAEPLTAQAVIRTIWDIDQTENDLSYDTTAVFEYDPEATDWKLRFTPQILAPELQEGDTLRARYLPADRGRILGAADQVLVSDRPVVRVGLDKSHLQPEQWEQSARELAELVEIDETAYTQRVAASGERAWVQAIVLRDDAQREISTEQITQIPGAGVQQDTLPLAPTRTFARALLGSVGPATAEIVENSAGRIQPDQQVGLAGLQASYNDTLGGTPGTTITRHSASGEPQNQLFTSPAIPGSDVRLTLDPQLQQLAESVLADSASVSALVAIRPSDAAVLAVASGPEDNTYNTALLGQYAPGSTFKVASALAMLRAGATPETLVDCPATTTVDGKSFKNYDGYPSASLGEITLSEALAQSCNTVFVSAGAQLGAEQLAQAAAALGLGQADQSGAGAFTGQVPSSSEGTELAANMIGQGVVQSSVFAMATVAASIAAERTISPQLVLDPSAEEAANTPTPSATGDLTAAEAQALGIMMRQAVEQGTLEILQDLPGGEVRGKSGTAEYDAERNAHAWTIAIQDDLAVAAFVEDGSGGAQTAGPLVQEFLSELPR